MTELLNSDLLIATFEFISIFVLQNPLLQLIEGPMEI